MSRKKQNLDDLNLLANLMDDRFKGPFGIRFGLDGLLGLIPGFGDILTNIISFYIVIRATLIGYPASIIMRMCFNVAVDNLVDMIPFLGVFLDFAWKANRKNMQLINEYRIHPKETEESSFWLVAVTFTFCVGLILSVFISSLLILAALISLVIDQIPI